MKKAVESGKILLIAGRRNRNFGKIILISLAKVKENDKLEVIAGIQNPVEYAEQVNKVIAEGVAEIVKMRREAKEQRKAAVKAALAKKAEAEAKSESKPQKK